MICSGGGLNSFAFFIANRFTSAGVPSEEWVKTFKEAGAGYIVFTTKHHDGFCMFNTRLTDYHIMHTPFGRDIAKALADACHKHGLRITWKSCASTLRLSRSARPCFRYVRMSLAPGGRIPERKA